MLCPTVLHQSTLCLGSFPCRRILDPPLRGHPALGAVPRTSCSWVCDLTTRLCFLLNFCKSTSLRPVLVGCDGLLGKLLGARAGWGQVNALPHSAQPHRDPPPKAPAALTSG